MVRPPATHQPTLSRTSQRTTPTPAHHGLPHLPNRIHRNPLPDHHHRPTRQLAHPHPQPMAQRVLPPDRHPLTNRNPATSTTGQTGRRTNDPEQRSDRGHMTPTHTERNPDRHPDRSSAPHNRTEASSSRSQPQSQAHTTEIACFRTNPHPGSVDREERLRSAAPRARRQTSAERPYYTASCHAPASRTHASARRGGSFAAA